MAGIDTGIAGCGIAGLACALLLHRQGLHKITLYERFDEPRPLGSGLMIQPTGLAVLEQLGLARQVFRCGAAVDRLYGKNARGRVVLDARYAVLGRGGAFGIGIHRASLFSALYDAVKAEGIEIRTGSEITGSMLVPGGRNLLFADGSASPPHDLLIDALGIHTRLAPSVGRLLDFGALWTSLEWPADSPFDGSVLEQRYRAAREMVGVLPIGSGPGGGRPQLALFWSLRADAVEGWREAGLTAWKDAVLRLWPECEGLLGQIADPAQLTFARYAHRTLPDPVGERIVHIGDAWHSASPQLGQGANMALLDAFALATSLAREGPLEQRLAHMLKLRRGHVQLYQWLTAAFTPLYQSESALAASLRDRLLAPLSRIGPAKWIQAMLVGGLAGAPLGPLGLAMPDFGQPLVEKSKIAVTP
ncbi:MAG: FAD-dependent monooxygenase [Proteobacteria bacterium]|nr:MAG: FAD-dependent monooxygenase [Pseudomonadota bacterium]